MIQCYHLPHSFHMSIWTNIKAFWSWFVPELACLGGWSSRICRLLVWHRGCFEVLCPWTCPFCMCTFDLQRAVMCLLALPRTNRRKSQLSSQNALSLGILRYVEAWCDIYWESSFHQVIHQVAQITLNFGWPSISLPYCPIPFQSLYSASKDALVDDLLRTV